MSANIPPSRIGRTGDKGRTSSTTDSVSRLADGVAHTLWVVAFNDAGKSDAARVRCRTVGDDWLNVRCSASGVLTVRWSDPSGGDPDPSGYTVTVRQDGSRLVHTYRGTDTSTSATVAAGKRYQVSLRSLNGNGGPVYIHNDLYTCPNPSPLPVVAAPTNLQAACSADGISMSWDVIASRPSLVSLRKFNVEINGKAEASIDYSRSTASVAYLWDEAVAGTTYKVRVKELSKQATRAGSGDIPWQESSWTPALSVPCPVDSQPEFEFRHDVSIVPQPKGFLTNSCWTRALSESENLHTCRFIEESSSSINKSSPQILEVSEDTQRYGRMIILTSGDTLEGCKSYITNAWTCQYKGTKHWEQLSQSRVTSQFYYQALTKMDPAGAAACALNLIQTWLVGSSGEGLASIFDSCREYLS